MDKLTAIKEIVWETNNMKPSKASLKRIRKAADVLGFDDLEVIELEEYLAFRNAQRELFAKFQ